MTNNKAEVHGSIAGAGAATVENANTAPGLVSVPCGVDEIKQVLPHREPFLWLTRVVECDFGSHVVAELDVSPELPLFNGHFPQHPVLPGVIIMEALAQAACFCVMGGGNYAGKLGFFAKIDKAKFRNQVLPGTTLRLEATIIKANRRMCTAQCIAFVDGAVAAEATQSYVLGE